MAALVIGMTLAGLAVRTLHADTGRRLVASGPVCLESGGHAGTVREESVILRSGEVRLVGRFFVPDRPGLHPAVVLMHGGGRENLNEAPLFFAPLLARCGVAVLVYDKRGTGESGGVWEDARFDDFVADAEAAVAWLTRHPGVAPHQVGVVGFSQGGRLAPLVAGRRPDVAFVVSVSAPFVSVAETRLYALEQYLLRRGLPRADLAVRLDLWRRHLAAVAEADLVRAADLDREIADAARRLGPFGLPPMSHQWPRSPVYNSLGRDYAEGLELVRVPLLAVYGERDELVPVAPSIDVLRRALPDEHAVDLVIVPFANHSFNDLTFNERIHVEEVILDWILNHLDAASLPGIDPPLTKED